MRKNKKAKSKPRVRVSNGSRNVFADLGLPDAEELETKSKLVLEITRLIKERALTQTQAASLLSIDQPRVSDLFTGKLRGFSVYKLMHFVAVLGRKVDIVMRNPAQPKEVEAIAIS
jgi:predicted XRE-type DNA-binding protein